jgi:hypothetical protein
MSSDELNTYCLVFKKSLSEKPDQDQNDVTSNELFL